MVRRSGESPFEATGLNHLAGHLVEAQGEVDRQYFFVAEWSVLDDD
ncbi:hypothetical protein AB0442_08085 [Kitasatospora sp. NPDC085895]